MLTNGYVGQNKKKANSSRCTINDLHVFRLILFFCGVTGLFSTTYAADTQISNEVTSTQISIDGSLGDWGSATYFEDDPDDISGTNNQIDWLHASMAHDGTHFYVAYQNRGNIHPTQATDNSYLDWGYQTFLDTDKDSSTGYAKGTIGADYILEGNSVQRYTGTGQDWSWETLEWSPDIHYQNDVAEIRFARALIGNPSSMHLVFSGNSAAFSGDTTDLYPDTGFFTYNFTNTPTPVPAVPTLVGPGGDITNTTPTYLWNAVSGATHYSIDFNGSTTGEHPDLSASEVSCASGESQCSFSAGNQPVGTSRNWRVRAQNTAGNSAYSPYMNFTVTSSGGGNTGTTIANEVTSTQISIDGSLGDWGSATYFEDDPDDISGTNNQIDWLRASMAHDETHFYVAYQNRGNIHPTQVTDNSYLDWGYQTFLDTDKDSSTGYAKGTIGADYILEGNSVQRYTGTGQDWSWETLEWSPDIHYQNDVAEIRFARALIGNPASMHLVLSGNSATFGGDATDLYPDTGFFTYNFSNATDADTVPPIITVNGGDITILLGSAYVDAGATAIDDRDGSIEVVTTGFVDINNTGAYVITYTATDGADNTATETRTVNVVVNPISTNGSRIPSTGANTVFNDFDDAYYRAGTSRSYSRNATHETVSDNINGLLWQDNIDAKTLKLTWSEANNYCENLVLGGVSNWRLPTRLELLYLVDFNRTGRASNDPVIDLSFEQTSVLDGYLTADTVTLNATYAAEVNFDNGKLSQSTTSSVKNFRCVSGLEQFKPKLIRGTNVVIDTNNHLEWQDDEIVQTNELEWQAALNYCEGLELNGVSDWRLPNNNEYHSILKELASHSYNNSIFRNQHNFTVQQIFISEYSWTSSTSFKDVGDAWGAYSVPGTSKHNHTYKSREEYVRCVRNYSNKPPIANAGEDQTVLEGLNVTLDASSSSDSDGVVKSYEWREGDTILSTDVSFTKADFTPGEHIISLSIKDDDNDTSSDEVVITISEYDGPIAYAQNVDTTQSSSILITLNASGGVTDNLNFSIVSSPQNGTIAGIPPSITYIPNDGFLGDDSFSFKADDGQTDSNVARVTINVKRGDDVIPPVITLNDGVSSLIEGSTYVDAGATATDNIDGTVSVTTQNLVNTNIPGIYTVTYTATDSSGNTTTSTRIVTIRSAQSPNTENFTFENFGKPYLDLIPLNATKTHYDEERFSLVSGQIFNESGDPLTDVIVSIHKHGEYGSTLTDVSGNYAIPVEGGLPLIVRYSKPGFTTIDRRVTTPINDWVRAPDVTMLALDSKITTIDLSSTVPQTHRSTIVTDERGSRATTLVFNGITKATVTSTDGNSRELTSIDVGATEFKTPESMPSDLPRESAFTYCSDLRVDGVSDEENVVFDAPVVMYVDNFLGFEVGEAVPVGYYARNEAEWKASDNGVVVKLLDTDNDGNVDALDSDGDDIPNDLNNNGDFSDEVSGISNDPSYSVGKTYWRASFTHFTPWDLNWPWAPPLDAKQPDRVNAEGDDTPPNDCPVKVNSYITAKTRVFHEDISIAGTDMQLHYSSKRTSGYKYIIDVSSSSDTLPTSVEGAIIKLEVAGKRYLKYFPASTLQKAKFEWDGLDSVGRKATGNVKATVSVGYVYRLVYYSSNEALDNAWARPGVVSTNVRGRDTHVLWNTKEISIDVEAKSDTADGIANGWGLSSYDKAFDGFVLRGNGTVDKRELVSSGIISNIGPFSHLESASGISIDKERGFFYLLYGNRVHKLEINSSDNNTTTFWETPLNHATDMALDKQGNLYIADNRNHRIVKIDTAGVVTTIAGNGEYGFSGDGGLATEASISFPIGVEVDSAGNIYIAADARIRKIDTSGYISTIAGDGNAQSSGDGGLAIEASVLPGRMAFDINGNLYFIDSGPNRDGAVRKIDTLGVITTIVGNGGSGAVLGDGGLATESSVYGPTDVAVDARGNIYIADARNYRVRKISDTGVITTIAGDGKPVYSSNPAVDGIAAEVSLRPDLLAVDIEGGVYISENRDLSSGYDHEMSVIRKLIPSPLFDEYALDSNKRLYKNPDNTADIFDRTGKHVKTIDLTTGNTLKASIYNNSGHLVGVADQFNNITAITRDSAGIPTLITAPDGQQTQLVIGSNGDLMQIQYEDGTSYDFSYFAGSLMDKMTDPNANITAHIFNSEGHITQEIDPEDGIWSFAKAVRNGFTEYIMTKPEGEQRISADSKLANGDIRSVMTLPDGESIITLTASDGSRVETNWDGVNTVTTFKENPTTREKVRDSVITTMPSGLSRTTSYEVAYETDNISTISKTTTITENNNDLIISSAFTNGVDTVTTPEGRVVTRIYDKNTRLTSSLSVGTLTPTTFDYDAKGRLTRETTGSRVISYTYDDKGNVETVTEPGGNIILFSYDIMDRLTQVTHPNGTTEFFEYDNNGNRTKRITPTPSSHSFTFNGVDKRKTYNSSLDSLTTYTYDKNRRLTEISRPGGSTISNTYDKDRLVSVTTPEGITNYTYLFADKIGKITRGNEEFIYSYDGNLLTSIEQKGTLNQNIAYSYNNDFLVSSSTYAGTTSNYSYDKDNLLNSGGGYTLTRDSDNGYIIGITDATLTQTRSYSGFGEITQVNDNTYTYEVSGRNQDGAITQKQETLDGTTHVYDYTYDEIGRLIEVKKNGTPVEVYAYDANGNRITSTVNGSTATASYNLDDQLIAYADKTYAYGDDGYLFGKITPDGTTTYTYGSLDELKKVVTSDKIIDYLHNANSQRVAKKVDGVVQEKYLWENLTRLLAIYDKDDNVLQRFEYAGQRMPVSMSVGSDKYYLHYDQVGSLRAVSDTNHNIVKQVDYDTFGNILNDSNQSITIPFGFAGGLYDKDTGLVRFGFRDYDPETGRWTAKDPIDFAGGDSNLYGYVFSDPVNLIDPDGLRPGRTISRNPRNISRSEKIRRAIQSLNARLKNLRKKEMDRHKKLELIGDLLEQIKEHKKQLDYYSLKCIKRICPWDPPASQFLEPPNDKSCSSEPPPIRPSMSPMRSAESGCKCVSYGL